MMCAFRRLRRDEEGQALVLAAVFGLVLMVCVLGTVNLGRAVYEKVQLQTAADAAAYSQAAVEARVLNFTAYTNRAMVVHYASILAASAYLTWVHFLWSGIKPALEVLKAIPIVGGAAAALDTILSLLVSLLDVGVATLTPLLCALNMLLYALQEGAWWSVYGRLAALPPEAHSGDSAAHPYRPIFPGVIEFANQVVFAQTRGHEFLGAATAESSKILRNAKSEAVQEARLHMLEIANSARDPWVAHGGLDPSASPLSRHFRWKFLCAQLGTVARAELGGFTPGSGALGGLSNAQVWSGQRLQASIDCKVKVGLGFVSFKIGVRAKRALFTLVTMDHLFGKNSAVQVWSPFFLIKLALNFAIPGLTGTLDAMEASAKANMPTPDVRLFWLSPYVYFAPRASARPQPGFAGKLGNFAQPDVLVGLVKDGGDFDREGGPQLAARRVVSHLGGTTDFRYQNNVPQLPPLPRGLTAFAAAQAYYHRPGEWREMPNFFNPLWSARLMPVLESNAAAKLRLTAVLPKQLLLH